MAALRVGRMSGSNTLFDPLREATMRPLFPLVVGLLLTAAATGQDVPARFGVLHNPDLYKQETPQEALAAALGAVARERYDYLAAHLLDAEWVDGRLTANRAYYDRVAGEQIVSTAAGAALRGAELDARVREVSTRLNFQRLTADIRRKLADEPANVKDLARFAREGQFQVAGETAKATLKDVPDRALYFKKANNRWFLENRKDEAAGPPPKE
jgi:hypothetical protein